MKNINYYIASFLLLIIYSGCDKPAPTELVENEEQVEVEIISQNPEDEFYSNGFDSTGIAQNPLNFNNIITISRIKTSPLNDMPGGMQTGQSGALAPKPSFA